MRRVIIIAAVVLGAAHCGTTIITLDGTSAMALAATSAVHKQPVPACPDHFTFEQPDGISFRARKYGDEFYNWMETESGWTLTWDPIRKRYEYLDIDHEGRFVFSGLVVGVNNPGVAGIPQHVRESVEIAGEKSMQSRQSVLYDAVQEASENVPAAGTVENLVILANFSDTITTYLPSDFEGLFNEAGYSLHGAKGSVRDYYKEASYGSLTVNTTISPWVTLPHTLAYYGGNNPASGNDMRPREMVQDAIAALDAMGFDFSRFDADGDGWVDSFSVIHQGPGEEAGGGPDTIWSHAWTIFPVRVDGVWISSYHTEPETFDTGLTAIGVICHEFGHALGLPDLYDTDGSSGGIGRWGIMGHGCWNNSGRRPGHFSSWSKIRLGWLTPSVLGASQTEISLSKLSNYAQAYKIIGGMAANEYLLIENRQTSAGSFDDSLPGSGLIVYHIDDSQGNNQNEMHYMVGVLQADGLWHLENNIGRGDTGDPFPGSANNRLLSASTNPNTNSYINGNTGITISSITDSSDSMNFDLSLSSYIHPVAIYVDDNANGRNDGSSWADAFNYLQDALTHVHSNPDINEIWVATGVYRPDEGSGQASGDRNASFHLDSGVAVYGGFPQGGGTWQERDPNAYITYLSGDLLGNDGNDFSNISDNSYSVLQSVEVDQTAILDGFTVTGGAAEGEGDGGGGMRNNNSAAVVRNCVFTGNCIRGGSGGEGAGVHNTQSPMTFIRCTISHNDAAYPLSTSIHGGGMLNRSSNVGIIDCSFIRNGVGWEGTGGAIYNEASDPNIKNSTFIRNYSWGSGGAISGGNPVISNCIFLQNATSETCTVGGAVSCSGGYISNCVFYNNQTPGGCAGTGGGGLAGNDPVIVNSIFWGNDSYGSSVEKAQIQCNNAIVAYCCIEGLDIYVGNGNIGDEPGFVDPNGPDTILGTADDDLRLLWGSPCIDAGSNELVPRGTITDLDGGERFVDDVLTVDTGHGTAPLIDMGAYEYKVIYVNAIATGGENTGNNWTDAYTNLQDALDAAAYGDYIWVAQGIYKPSRNYGLADADIYRLKHFRMINGIGIYGGFPVFFSDEHIVGSGLDGIYSVSAADIDSDGDIDVLGAVWNKKDIAWWENVAQDGTTWTEHIVDGEFDGASSVLAADVDGDGDLDVLGTGTEADDITWWENVTGDGTVWTEHTINGNFDGAISVDAVDMDGDGDIDVIGAAKLAYDVIWYENTVGDGTAWTEHTVDSYFYDVSSVHTGDIDGDGDLDVLGAGYKANDIVWWENAAGNGTVWNKHFVDGNFGYASSVYAADIDHDGHLDIIGAGASVDDITWWETTAGDGSAWTKRTIDDDFDCAWSVYANDIDGDGDVDVLGAAYYGNDITWWENAAGNGSVWKKHTIDGDFTGAISVCAADVDGDNDIDVIGASHQPPEVIAWWENKSGSFPASHDPNFSDRDPATCKTVLSGDLLDNDNYGLDPSDLLHDQSRLDNCYHVFYHPNGLNLTCSAVLDGFTITAGNADQVSLPDQYRSGSGMYNCNNSPRVSNCVFTANAAVYHGGAMFNSEFSDSMVVNCTFSGNTAELDGGALYNADTSDPTVSNCTVEANLAGRYGGGICNRNCSSPIVYNCIFDGNRCYSYGNGGGMYNASYSSPIVASCSFTNNSAIVGGGMANWDSSSPVVSNCVFDWNSASDDGGGMGNCSSSSPAVTNSTFSDNSAYCGAGMFNWNSSNPTVANCAFSGNSAVAGGGGIANYTCIPSVSNCIFSNNSAEMGGGMYGNSIVTTNCTFGYNSAGEGGGISCGADSCTVTNCILWGNSDNSGTGETAQFHGETAMINYSCIEGWTGNFGGIGNINLNPLFADPYNIDATLRNYHLLSYSPCIDAGDPVSAFDVEPEPNGGRINMGAYGNTAEATPTVDSDGDGITDPQEARWGLNPDSNDTDGDGLTDHYEVCYDGDCSDYQPYPAGSDLNAGCYDTDGDGMDDGWEMLYPGCVNPVNGSDGGGDCDNDGFTNWRECRYRTAPSDANSKPVSEVITIIVDDDGPADFSNIQAAIDSSIDGDTIIVRPGIYTGTGNRDIDFLGKAITVQSVHPNDPCSVVATTIDCGGALEEYHRGFIFQRGEDANSVLDGLMIINGFADSGGGIYCFESGPLIRNCILKRNTAQVNEDNGSSYGGGLYCVGGNCTLLRCSFDNNGAADDGDDFGDNAYGGAIYCRGGSIEIDDCSFNDNICGGGWGDTAFGGGLCCVEATAVVRNCVFANNTSYGHYGWPEANVFGGAISNSCCTVTLSDSVFEDNRAIYEGQGGAVYNYMSEGTINNCDFTGNDTYTEVYCDGEGGALYNDESTMAIKECRFMYNRAGYEGVGGAVYNKGGYCKFEYCQLFRNDAWGRAGGICVADCDSEILRCDFIDNDSAGCAGALDVDLGRAQVTDCRFSANSSGSEMLGGAAINTYNCELTVINSIFEENVARTAYGAGAIQYGWGSTGTTLNCTFFGNTYWRNEYSDGVAAIRCYSNSTCDVKNCIFLDAEYPEIDGAGLNVTYSNVHGGWSGTGNIYSDPCFVAPGGQWDDNGTPTNFWDNIWVQGDYYLESAYGRWDTCGQSWVYDDVNSPCIDAGDPNSDWTGELWPNGGRINMGAYGGTSEASMSAFGPGNPIDIDNSGIVNLIDYSVVAGKWYAGQARTIPHGTVVVDGDLSDWPQDAQWIPLDKIYYGDPCDVNSAKFTLCWNDPANKIYAAVVVNDSDHHFTDAYVSWNASDRLEIYSQGSAAGGGGFWHPTNPEWDSAQQYMVGPDTAGGCWASWGMGGALPLDVGLECSVSIAGDLITYEVAVTPYENYGGITGGPTVQTPLAVGSVIAFDFAADTLWSGNFGMLSENLMLEKYKKADSFRHYAVSSYILAPPYKPLEGDINRDQVVDEYDLQSIAEAWLE